MDDNLTAVLMLATLETMIVAVTWLIVRGYVKGKRIEREPLPVEPDEWEDGIRIRDADTKNEGDK